MGKYSTEDEGMWQRHIKPRWLSNTPNKRMYLPLFKRKQMGTCSYIIRVEAVYSVMQF